MKNKVIEIATCNDCPFATSDELGNYFCSLDDTDNEILTMYEPLKVGVMRLIDRENCFFDKKTLTFKKLKLKL